jgi:hypothetical protein
MKFLRATLLTLVVLAIAVVGLQFLLSGDVVTNRYKTLALAREDKLFERGWLPEILPASSQNIRTSNNLDLNTSEGEFSFAPADFDSLRMQMVPIMVPEPRFATQGEYIATMRSRGFETFQYTAPEGRLVWFFFCKPQDGYCEYVVPYQG